MKHIGPLTPQIVNGKLLPLINALKNVFVAVAVLIAAALLFVLPPLLRRKPELHVPVRRAQANLAVLQDQLRELRHDLDAGLISAEAYERARHDLERRVAEDVRPEQASRDIIARGKTALTVGLGVPAAAMSLYVMLGTPTALESMYADSSAAHEVTQADIEGMVVRLAQRLESQPKDADGWHLLARSYNALGDYRRASEQVKDLPASFVLNDSMSMTPNARLSSAAMMVVEARVSRSGLADPEQAVAQATTGPVKPDARNLKIVIRSR